eukprot:SAG22_NODE_5011_length_1108_cov_1.420218_2_plen_172_part_00
MCSPQPKDPPSDWQPALVDLVYATTNKLRTHVISKKCREEAEKTIAAGVAEKLCELAVPFVSPVPELEKQLQAQRHSLAMAELADPAPALWEELAALLLSTLKNRARAAGVPEAVVDGALDADEPAAALGALIVAAEVAKHSAHKQAEEVRKKIDAWKRGGPETRLSSCRY